MKWNSQNAHHLMALTDAISALDNVKPRKAIRLLKDAKEAFFDQICRHMIDQKCALHEKTDLEEFSPHEIGPDFFITWDEIEQIMVEGAEDDWGNTRLYITPEGAKILIKLYSAEVFELKKKRDGISTPVELIAYSKKQRALESKFVEEQELNQQEKEQELYWEEHPSELPESLFTPSRLNRIMFKNVGLGLSTSMEIGGIKICKNVHYYTSNSGGRRDCDVFFEWVGSDGNKHKEHLRHSTFKNNRRNDSERNWGLHE